MKWIKSSRSAGGNCVEVAYAKSSRCASNGCVEVAYVQSSQCNNGTCVEVGQSEHTVYIRDSKDPNIAPIRVPAAAWTVFLDAVTAGEITP